MVGAAATTSIAVRQAPVEVCDVALARPSSLSLELSRSCADLRQHQRRSPSASSKRVSLWDYSGLGSGVKNADCFSASHAERGAEGLHDAPAPLHLQNDALRVLTSASVPCLASTSPTSVEADGAARGNVEGIVEFVATPSMGAPRGCCGVAWLDGSWSDLPATESPLQTASDTISVEVRVAAGQEQGAAFVASSSRGGVGPHQSSPARRSGRRGAANAAATSGKHSRGGVVPPRRLRAASACATSASLTRGYGTCSAGVSTTAVSKDVWTRLSEGRPPTVARRPRPASTRRSASAACLSTAPPVRRSLGPGSSGLLRSARSAAALARQLPRSTRSRAPPLGRQSDSMRRRRHDAENGRGERGGADTLVPTLSENNCAPARLDSTSAAG
eukprot:TRINITY_DN13980_c0_g2_i1.p1 TRINITY_DN13980_c0_g2~~TRINITY_DN13980_c0_g2_i1.p1  ORF type:complete len:389 (-),score=41.48 TRINITY_DN13980_c0_g2_i1:69-1235(-)